jgi:hypothetical protein
MPFAVVSETFSLNGFDVSTFIKWDEAAATTTKQH